MMQSAWNSWLQVVLRHWSVFSMVDRQITQVGDAVEKQIGKCSSTFSKLAISLRTKVTVVVAGICVDSAIALQKTETA